MQHSLPRMIHQDGIGDPSDWLLDRASLHPQEDNVLGSALTLCRLLGLYEGLMDFPADGAPDGRLLAWLEGEGETWREKWFGPHSHIKCLPLQSAFMLFCYHVYRFQLAEAALLLSLKAGARAGAETGSAGQGHGHGLDAATAVAKQVMGFGLCTDAAMAVLNTFTAELSQTLPMAQDAVFIGA